MILCMCFAFEGLCFYVFLVFFEMVSYFVSTKIGMIGFLRGMAWWGGESTPQKFGSKLGRKNIASRREGPHQWASKPATCQSKAREVSWVRVAATGLLDSCFFKTI